MDEKGTLEVSFFEKNIDKAEEGVLGKIKPGPYSVINVKDNGSGMDEETLSHIFEPFYTTRKVGDGTGMGLSVVFGIVRNHKGNIVVNSIPEEGSEFSVFFPQKIQRIRQESMDNYPLLTGSHEHIMIIDDEEINCDLFSDLLENKGYNVITFCDSQEALDYLDQNEDKVDLIISDPNHAPYDGLGSVQDRKGKTPSYPSDPLLRIQYYCDRS